MRAAALPVDLSDLTQSDSLLERAEHTLGPLDLLVNNAGLELTSDFCAYTRAELAGMIDLNLTAPLPSPTACSRACSPVGGPRGVHRLGRRQAGPAYQAPYAATKAGLVGLTQSLRSQYRHGTVGFSVVCPGFIAGDGMYQRMVEEGVKSNRLMGETTLERVCDATVRAVRRDLPEVIESGAPLRPALALAVLAPGLAERIAPRFGVTELFRRTAVLRGRGG